MFASFAYQFMVECTKKKLEVIGGWEVGAATPLSPPSLGGKSILAGGSQYLQGVVNTCRG